MHVGMKGVCVWAVKGVCVCEGGEGVSEKDINFIVLLCRT